MNVRDLQIQGGRAGTSSLELLIAFTLLASVIAFATPLAVRHRRLLGAQRDYRFALDELSNQLDRLEQLSDPDLRQALMAIRPSKLASTRLPGIDIQGQLDSIDVGQRLTLSLSWDDHPRTLPPISMTAWIVPRTTATAVDQPGRGQP